MVSASFWGKCQNMGKKSGSLHLVLLLEVLGHRHLAPLLLVLEHQAVWPLGGQCLDLVRAPLGAHVGHLHLQNNVVVSGWHGFCLSHRPQDFTLQHKEDGHFADKTH